MATLIVPGLRGSGPGHWQRWWLRNDPEATLVDQADWRNPGLAAWAARLVEAIERNPGAWLVAHSLGVPLVAHVAATRLDLRIGGALLVAPADVERLPDVPDGVRSFAPVSLAPLPFPATLVASRTDPCMEFRRARSFAAAWGAALVDYGDAGHINVASAFGPWPDGMRLLDEVQRRRRPSATVIHLRPRASDAGRAIGRLA